MAFNILIFSILYYSPALRAIMVNSKKNNRLTSLVGIGEPFLWPFANLSRAVSCVPGAASRGDQGLELVYFGSMAHPFGRRTGGICGNW